MTYSILCTVCSATKSLQLTDKGGFVSAIKQESFSLQLPNGFKCCSIDRWSSVDDAPGFPDPERPAFLATSAA